MARPFEKIADINDQKELWKVVVRVDHKWNVFSNNKQHFEMIFIDKEGSEIHVIVPNMHMGAYNSKFELDHTYTVSNFAVQPNNLVFKPTEHRFMLKLTGGTAVSDVDKHDVPVIERKLTSFIDINSGRYKKDVLINIIGMIDTIGYAQTEICEKKLQANFLLRDSSNNTVNRTLWEDYAKQFFKFQEDRGDAAGPIVVLLQYAKVKEAGQYPLSVTNTFYVTKLSINGDLPQIKVFIESCSRGTLETISNNLSSLSQSISAASNSNNVRVSPTQKLLRGVVPIPLSEVKKLRTSTICVTFAKTNKLIASSHGWYYRCCHECTKTARGEQPPFKCDAGHITEAEIYKYKMEIQGVHLGTSCKFIFWDRECTAILRLSAAQMRESMIQGGITDPLEYPLQLDKMLGLELALRVKWQPDWDNCSVVMLIEDEAFVKQLKAPWENIEVNHSQQSGAPNMTQIKESVDEAKTDVGDDAEIVTDIEITSKHNPDPTTPTGKRQNHNASSNTTSADGLCDGELSSTKLKKIIKLESKT